MAIDPPSSSPTPKSPLSSSSSSKWKHKKKKEMMIKKTPLNKKPTNLKHRNNKVSYDLSSRNLLLRSDPKSASKDKLAAIERANVVRASLPLESPSFVKLMFSSHVTAGFWLGLSKKFCDAHLPKHDETVVLVDEKDEEYNTKFLVDKTGLSGGWRGFSIAHKLLEGDALVFQLIDHCVHYKGNGGNEIAGAITLLNLAPCDQHTTTTKNEPKNIRNPEGIDIELQEQNTLENNLQLVDNSAGNNDYANSLVSERVRFSQSVLEFEKIKNIDDFSIIMNGLVIDSEIPKHFQTKYYALCQSQKAYLHESLLTGLNVKLAIGIILETVTISDAIRACSFDVTSEDLGTWDKTLEGFELMGMKVGFLRARVSKLNRLLFESNRLSEEKKEKKRELVKAEDDMRVTSEKLREVIKNLDVEIEILKLKEKNLELDFCEEAAAPW